MKLQLDPNALEDLQYWLKEDRKMLQKIFVLFEDMLKNPFKGLGKPEPLKFYLQLCWSRRINQEHRIVYKVEEENIIVLMCRYHY